MTKEIYYFLKIRAANCAYEIRINDIIALEDDDGGFLKTEFCLNYLCTAGINAIKVILIPSQKQTIFPNDAICEIKIIERDQFNFKDGNELLELKSPEFNENNQVNPTIITKNFNSKLDKRFLWENSLAFSENDFLKNEVLDYYKKIWTLIKNKNIDGLMNEFKLREEEYADYLFSDINERINGTRIEFEDVINTNDILPLTKETYLRFFANRKLVTLKDKYNKDVLHLIDENSLNVTFPILLMRKDKDLIAIR